ncbi:hypothetical protein ACFVH0_20065 [Streptomyces sp. NPDC127117]|uniref:hypothetical protein n=1 Tax=Streptomyces sp. NPDC127117 TaxID=3345368 RepID=UPI0036456C28
MRRISTRAQITAHRMVNGYEWGDFKGDPVALVERHSDAHLYFADWSSRRPVLRVAAARVPLEAALPAYDHRDHEHP